MKPSILPLLLALLLVPGLAFAGPGDAAPDMGDDDDDDDDDTPAPFDDDDDDDEPAPAVDDDDDDAEPEADEDADDLQLPELEGDRADEAEEESSEEDEEALDDRYRVVVPGSDDDAATAQPEEDEEDEDVEVEDDRRRRGLVKVIQKKFFLKYRRVEVTPQIGFVGNDHFIRRMGVGLSVGFHINEILALEILASYLPDLGETDYKALTKRFRNEEEVVPDISRVVFLGVLNMVLSPIYGKVELGTLRIINYDIYIGAGLGIASTKDDTAIIRSPCDGLTTVRERKADTANGCHYVDQTHFVTNAGGGLRIVFNDWIGVRLDARQFTHIEQVYRDESGQGEIGLEMKQNFMISLGASFFFPPKARALPL